MANEPLDEEQIALTEDEIKKLKSLEEADGGPRKSEKPLIQGVTHTLRSCYSKGECKRYFKPTFVAIGPLNHQKGNTRDLRFDRGEQWKQQLAAIFINFCGNAEQFYKNIKKHINSLRKHYDIDEVKKWNDEELALMFLVDGCALLHFIALDVTNQWEEFSVINDLVGIEKVDFFLLENQLPYQLLGIILDSIDKVANVESPNTKPKELFEKFIEEFIDRSFLSLTAQEQPHHSQPQPQNQVDHSQPHSPKGLIGIFNLCGMRRVQKQPQNRFHPSQTHFDDKQHSQPHSDDEQHSQPHSDDDRFHHSQPHSPMGFIRIFNLCGMRRVQKQPQTRFHPSQTHFDDEQHSQPHSDDDRFHHSQPHSDDDRG
ncbi:hypothetical protein SLA2020_201960 [Shorea laevis]